MRAFEGTSAPHDTRSHRRYVAGAERERDRGVCSPNEPHEGKPSCPELPARERVRQHAKRAALVRTGDDAKRAVLAHDARLASSVSDPGRAGEG
jgi:hypothetical protein